MSIQGGIWNLDQEPINRQLLQRMSALTADSGPDQEGAHFHGPIGLFYRAFFTTSESRLERQPYISRSGIVVTWDGRLDNREDLIQQLDDTPPNSTDVAIVANAFERWDRNTFSKLTGDWAMVVWNPIGKELLLARDYIGVRQLYYSRRDCQVVWCSHLAPIVLVGDSLKLCEDYFAGYLCLWPKADLTPYQEILSVPPGSFVQLSGSQMKVERYWHPNPKIKIRYKSDADYEEHFRHVFRQSVRRRLRADAPILADLSGGLDSSSIVCMADDILSAENAETPRLDTFSMSDRSEPGEEDFHYYTKVEQKRGRIGHHAELHSTGDSLCFDYSNFVPVPGFGDREEVKTMRRRLIAEHGYRVRLSGIGGDEVSGSALDPCVQAADLLRQCRLSAFAHHLFDWILLVRRPWAQLCFDSLLLLLPVVARERLTPLQPSDGWIDKEFARKHRMQVYRLTAAEGRVRWRPTFRDYYQTLTNLSRQLTRTLPSDCEIRYPFLDQQLVEFLMYIPTDQLLRPGHRRSLMRRSLSRILPPEILSRRTKSSLGRCFILSIDKHWPMFEAMLSSPIGATLGWINKEQFNRALQAAKHGAVSDHFFQLLNSLSSELWLTSLARRGILSELPGPRFPVMDRAANRAGTSENFESSDCPANVHRQATAEPN